MKNNQLILSTLFALLLLIIACKNNTTEEKANEEATVTMEPVQWVTYKAKNSSGVAKKVVLVSGDEEYRSEEALPQLAKILSTHHGFDCTVLFAQDPASPGIIDPNYTKNIPGLEALDDADLMILFTRFRALPDEQMQHFKNYLSGGKPVIAIRTATHAFNFKDTTSQWIHWGNGYNNADSPWDGGFGRLVLGERWYTHHGHHKHQSTRGIIADGAVDHPILKGIADGSIWGPTDVYGVRLPLPGDAMPLVLGQVTDRAGEFDKSEPFYGLKPTDTAVATTNSAAKKAYNPNKPMMPISWTKTYQIPEGKAGKAFTSTIGSSTDMVNESVRRLFVNATYHLLGMEVPAQAKVDVVGTYEPSAYQFQKDEYWDEKNLEIADLVE